MTQAPPSRDRSFLRFVTLRTVAATGHVLRGGPQERIVHNHAVLSISCRLPDNALRREQWPQRDTGGVTRDGGDLLRRARGRNETAAAAAFRT